MRRGAVTGLDEGGGGGARIGRRPRRNRGGRDPDEEDGVAGWRRGRRRRLVGRGEGDRCGGDTGKDEEREMEKMNSCSILILMIFFYL